MKVPALTITRYGGPEAFAVREVELPPPGPGQVRVKVGAAGINFAEVFCRLGLYVHAPKPPFVPGFELAGVVESVGPGVRRFQPGDRVLGVSRFGAYQGGALLDEARLRPIPAGWSVEQAAGFPAAALTAAYGLLELGRLRAGERVVVHSAAGGVGSMAVQLARALGAEVVGTVGRDEKRAVAEAFGCQRVFNHQTEDWAARLAEVGGADLIFDALGGDHSRAGYDRLRSRGRLVVYGFGTMTPTGRRPNYLKLAWQYLQNPRFAVFPMVSDNRSVAGFNVLLLWEEVDLLTGLLDRCLDLVAAGQLRVAVSEAAPYTEVGRLHEALQSGRTTGKLVITFP